MNIRLDMVGATNFCIGRYNINEIDNIRKLAKDDPLGELYTEVDLIECHYVNESSKLWVEHKEYTYDDFKDCIKLTDKILEPDIEICDGYLTYVIWIKDKETFASFEIDNFRLDKLNIIVSLKDNILVDILYAGDSIEYYTDYIDSWVDKVDIHYMINGETITETIT
jgi:hypothetical protein